MAVEYLAKLVRDNSWPCAAYQNSEAFADLEERKILVPTPLSSLS